MNSPNVPLKDRVVAAGAHLGYVGLGLVAGLLAGAPKKGLSVLAVLGVILLIGYAVAKSSEFVQAHGRQAKGYHRLGATLALGLACCVVWVAIFTWGLGTPLIILLVPAAFYWMGPTFLGARNAMQGKPYVYPTLDWFRAAKETDRPQVT